MTTKERIIEETLTLFAKKGYKGTSVKNIADAVGIKDASLYNHFKSKQEILEAIVDLINVHINDLSQTLEIPNYDNMHENTNDFYARFDLNSLKALSRKIFIFYLADPYISRFWRIAHMEQYQNEKIYGMFQKIFMEDAITYQTKLFERMMEQGILYKGDARATAINFYAPIFFLLTKYAGQSEKLDEALEVLDKQIEEFFRLYKVG